MVSTPLNLVVASHDSIALQDSPKASNALQSSLSFSLVIALICLTLVTVLVPERPHELASICEKHNSTIACRVW